MIAVIGGGPAGTYVARLLAKAGKKVSLFEEHETIGNPVQCTGIVTPSINKYVDLPKKVIARNLNKVIVVSKNNRMEAKTGEIVMWRNLFDQHLGELAEDAGVEVKTNHQFMGFNGQHAIKVKDKTKNETKEHLVDYVIAADGPSSAVAKAIGLDAKPKFWVGMQAKVKLKMEQHAFETYFGKDFPNFFGWVVPESEDTVRLGLGAHDNAREYFYKFLEQRTGSKQVECWESGIIPVHEPKKVIQQDNVFFIGDAATQVKATTGGGIIPSIKAALTLADCIINKKNYQQTMKWQSGKELLLHLKIRNMLNKFSDKDYDQLLGYMNQPRIKYLLNKYDRDTPIPLVAGLMLFEPRFLKYVKHAF